MKTIIRELRLLIAETLLGWALSAAPKETPEGKALATFVYDYAKNRRSQ